MNAIDVGLLALRLVLGVVFVAHGIKHARARHKTSRWFASIGFKAPDFQWLMSTATEIGAGALLIAGLLTSFASAAIVGIMFVAFWTVHRAAGFFITAFMKDGIDVEGWEYVFVLAVVAAALVITGPGELSVDHAIGFADAFDGWVGAAAALSGVVAGSGLLAAFWRPDRT